MKYYFLFLLGFAITANSFSQTQNPYLSLRSGVVSIGISDTIQSVILHENRIINISLPEEYGTDPSIRYPVIYLLDGGVAEDFIHITGMVRYSSTPWIKRIPPSIVVGIQNVNRKRDFTFPVPDLDFVPEKTPFKKTDFKVYGGSGKFINFFENELLPMINRTYRTNSTRTIIGESMAGLLVCEMLIKKPQLFDQYIIVSPSLWWGDESLLHQSTRLSAPAFVKYLNIYIAAADQAEDSIMYAEAKQLADRLKGFQNPHLTVHFDYIPEEKHATILHRAVYNAFKLKSE